VKPGCDSLNCSVAAQKADEEKKIQYSHLW
jgi:hypothetical protein